MCVDGVVRGDVRVARVERHHRGVVDVVVIIDTDDVVRWSIRTRWRDTRRDVRVCDRGDGVYIRRTRE